MATALADELGPELSFPGCRRDRRRGLLPRLRPPVSFAPYLDDMARRLGRQYLLTFLAKPEKKAGMQKVKLQTEVPNAELVSADMVYVPATPQ